MDSRRNSQFNAFQNIDSSKVPLTPFRELVKTSSPFSNLPSLSDNNRAGFNEAPFVNDLYQQRLPNVELDQTRLPRQPLETEATAKYLNRDFDLTGCLDNLDRRQDIWPHEARLFNSENQQHWRSVNQPSVDSTNHSSHSFHVQAPSVERSNLSHQPIDFRQHTFNCSDPLLQSTRRSQLRQKRARDSDFAIPIANPCEVRNHSRFSTNKRTRLHQPDYERSLIGETPILTDGSYWITIYPKPSSPIDLTHSPERSIERSQPTTPSPSPGLDQSILDSVILTPETSIVYERTPSPPEVRFHSERLVIKQKPYFRNPHAGYLSNKHQSPTKSARDPSVRNTQKYFTQTGKELVSNPLVSQQYKHPSCYYDKPSRIKGYTDIVHNRGMYPMTMDQSRQDNIPAQHTLQVHMHHLYCPCSNVIYPYYPPGYRPPLLAQPPPMPRPSYLHHYQYTQLHVNPAYNVPPPPPMAQHLPQSINHSPPSTVDLAFGPPPRDRRNIDTQEYEEQRQIADKCKSENRNSLLQYTPLSMDNNYGAVNVTDNLQQSFRNLTAAQVASLSTENYIKYLDNGCFVGETIAKRNEQRPCFKNIQNLCNRTRSEVMKPNITVSNIHSQGVPWATKDFIFAFVRAINCWCILRGYLGSKDGNLGKIDREISPEFRACYSKWEKCTKQLTHYLIQTFYKLDEANSSPNLNTGTPQAHSNPVPSTSASATTLISRTRNQSPPKEAPRKVVSVPNEPIPQNAERKLPNKEMALKGIPGILHIPPTSSADLGDVRNPQSESTEISPRDEESDCECRVYMKPGSYNVPRKQQSSQSTTNSPRSIEFLDTAQNVAAHHRKAATEKPDSYTSDILRDKVWQTAQNVTPEFIKQNEESSSTAGAENLYDVGVHQNRHIESWLNNEMNLFDCVALNDRDDETSQQPEEVPTALGISDKANEAAVPCCGTMVSPELEASARSYRNRPVPRNYSTFRKNLPNRWEYKNGGLTDAALAVFDVILKELKRTEFSQQVNCKIPFNRVWIDDNEMKNPTDLSTIAKKLKNRAHLSLNEVVHDFRHIICSALEYFTEEKFVMPAAVFRDKFEEMISHTFTSIDFGHISGEPNEALGPITLKQRGRPRKTAEGDGDH